MGLGYLYHSRNTLGKEPVIGMDHLAVLASRRYLAHCVVRILDYTQEFNIVVDPNPRFISKK
jgi:hypothetical protein